MATREELLSALSERLDAALDADDMSMLLIEEVLGQIEELAAQSDPRFDAEVAYLLGWVRWCPFEARLISFTEEELDTVVRWFETVYAVDRDAVPDSLRSIMVEIDPPHARAAADDAERLSDEYEKHHEPATLVRAIELLRASIAATPQHSYSYPRRLLNLSGLLGLLADEMPEGDLLGEAIDTAQAAFDAAEDPSIRERALGNIAQGLWQAYLGSGDPEPLREAIELLRENLDQFSAEMATRMHDFLDELSEEWAEHAEEFAHAAAEWTTNFDVQESISQLRAEFLTASPDDPDYGGKLADFAQVLVQAFDYAGYPELLDEAVRVAGEGAARTPSDAWFFHVAQNTVATIRVRRFRLHGDPVDLDHAVDAINRAVDSIEEDHAEYGHLTANRALITSAVPDNAGDAADFAGDARPDFAGDPERLSAVAGTLYVRGDGIHDMAAVSRAIGYTERALELRAADDIRRGDNFDMLSLLHQLRHRHGSLDSDVDAAITAAESSLHYAPEPGSRRAGFLANLASALLSRSAPGDDERRAELLGESVRLAMASGNNRRAIMALFNEFSRLVDVGEYAEAAQALIDSAGLFDQTLAPLAGHSPDHGRVRLGLAVLWSRIALATRMPDYFDQAMAATRRAVEVIVAEPNDNHGWLLELAGLARERANLFLDPADLDTAETALRHLLLSEPGPDHRGEAQWQLGAVLRLRHTLTADPALLDEAVILLRAALTAAELDEVNRRKIIGPGLAAALLARVAQGGGADADLDEGVALLADSVADRFDAELGATDAHARNLYNCAGALWQRYLARKDVADLDAAIDTARQAVEEMDPGEPTRAAMLCNLAVYLHRRSVDTGAAADWAQASANWRLAWETPGAPLVPLLRIALGWGTATTRFGDPAAGAEILDRGVALLPALAWRGLAHADRRLLLQAEAGELTQNATAAAIAAGRFERALELAEAGRGILWTQLREVRADLAGLRSAAPELAAQFEACAAALDGTGEPGEQPPQYGRAESARRFERLLAEIRRLDPSEGFPQPAEFLLPQSFSALRPQAPGEWIVLVNCSELRCDAVAVSRDHVIPIPLTGLDDRTAAQQAGLHVDNVERYAASRRTSTDAQAFDAGLARTAAWLWTAVAEPVLRALPDTPRLWWYPTGVLTVLPLHIAGLHAEKAGRTVLDRAVSSWATSLTHLAHARRARAADPGPMLIFAVPETPGLNPLPAVAQEVADLVKLMGAQQHTVLIGAAATRAALLSGLAEHTWLHVACHGAQDLFDPAAAGLYPYDWQQAGLVDIDDLVGTRGGRGEFAFLSACDTHVGDVHNLNESITLAAALQSRGWRHVIGAMWEIGDRTAQHVSGRVYPVLRGADPPNADAAAAALHAAALELRDADPHALRHWAPFLHIGP